MCFKGFTNIYRVQKCRLEEKESMVKRMKIKLSQRAQKVSFWTLFPGPALQKKLRAKFEHDFSLPFLLASSFEDILVYTI